MLKIRKKIQFHKQMNLSKAKAHSIHPSHDLDVEILLVQFRFFLSEIYKSSVHAKLRTLCCILSILIFNNALNCLQHFNQIISFRDLWIYFVLHRPVSQ